MLSQEEWLSKIEKKENKNIVKKPVLLNKKNRRLFLIAAVLFSFLYCTMASVATLNENKMVVQENNISDYININEKQISDKQRKKLSFFSPKYIPEGFSCYESEQDDYMSTQRYANKNGKYFSIYQYKFSDVNIDSEDYEKIYVDDGEIHYKKKDVYKIVYLKKHLKYEISGNISYDELKNIAKNIK